MTHATIIESPSRDDATSEEIFYDNRTLENCEAMIVCLDARRFVIVRPGEPKNIWPTEGGWDRIRDIQPGESVIYKGRAARVVAVDVYR